MSGDQHAMLCCCWADKPDCVADSSSSPAALTYNSFCCLVFTRFHSKLISNYDFFILRFTFCFFFNRLIDLTFDWISFSLNFLIDDSIIFPKRNHKKIFLNIERFLRSITDHIQQFYFLRSKRRWWITIREIIFCLSAKNKWNSFICLSIIKIAKVMRMNNFLQAHRSVHLLIISKLFEREQKLKQRKRKFSFLPAESFKGMCKATLISLNIQELHMQAISVRPFKCIWLSGKEFKLVKRLLL